MRLPRPLLERQARARAGWPPDRPVRFVTSFNDVFFEASGRACVETFRAQNPAWEIVAYIEGPDTALEAMGRELQDLGAGVELLAERPLLADFLERARDVIPTELGGDAPPEMFPGEGPQTGDVWFRKHMYRWFRKIVALDHAHRGFEGVLFWMDSDCRSVAPLPLAVVEQVFGHAGVVHMKHTRVHSETGLVGYDLGVPGVHELIDWMREHYMTRAFEAQPRWDDCITLDLGLARPGAPPARDIARRVRRHGDVLDSTPLAAYLEHDKGLHSRGLGLVR